MLASLLKMGTTWMEKQKPIRVQAGKCSHSRHKASACNKCVSVCPANAIQLNPEPQIDWDCIDCGLCVSVCPTEALEQKNRSLQGFYLEIKKYAERKETLSFRCPQVKGLQDSITAVPVTCLGQLDDLTIQLAMAEEVKEFYFFTGSCDQCRIHQGRQLFQERLETWKKHWPEIKWIETNQAETDMKPTEEKPLVHSNVIDRREFFKAVRQETTKAVVESIVKEKTETPWKNGELARQSSIRLYYYHHIVKPELENAHPLMNKQLEFLNHCRQCGICEKVCPTEAVIMDKASNKPIWFQEKCIDCGLCQDVCSYGAIDFHPKTKTTMVE